MVRMRRGAATLLLLFGVVFGTFGKPPEPEVLVQYAEQLDLTDLQRSTLRKVAVETQKTSILTEAQIRVTELGIRELLEQDTLDLPTIETEMRKLAELQAQMRMVRIRGSRRSRVQPPERASPIIRPISSWRAVVPRTSSQKNASSGLARSPSASASSSPGAGRQRSLRNSASTASVGAPAISSS